MPDNTTTPETILQVFLVTRNGATVTDDGLEFVKDFILGDNPDFTPEESAKIKAQLPENIDGVIIHTGPHLLDANNLADLLEDTPNAQLVISHNGNITAFDCTDDALKPLIGDLRAVGDKADSWMILDAILQETTGG